MENIESVNSAESKAQLIKNYTEKLKQIQQRSKQFESNENNLLNLETKILNDVMLLDKIVMELCTKQDYHSTTHMIKILSNINKNLENDITDIKTKQKKISDTIILLNDTLNDYNYGIKLNIQNFSKFYDIDYETTLNDTYNVLIHIKTKDKFKIHVKDEFNRLLILKMIDNCNKISNCNIQYDLSQLDPNTNIVTANYYLTR